MKPKTRPYKPLPASAVLAPAAAPVETTPAPLDRSLLPLVGELSIATPSGDHCDYVELQLTDDSSRARVVTIRVKVSEMMHALTGRYTNVTFETRSLHLIGTVIEHKQERVPYDRYQDGSGREAEDAVLAPYEVDGWKADRSDLTNHHRQARASEDAKPTQLVGFRRHVDPKTGKPVVAPRAV